MNARTLLADRIAHAGLCPGASTIEDWLRSSWVRFPFGARSIPVFPLWGLKKAHVAHDVHHAVLEYPTTVRGECELAAWEVASGGCRWNLVFWIDRLVLFAFGLVLYPMATWRAARSGWGRRNLYGMEIEPMLAATLEELGLRMRLQQPETKPCNRIP